MEQKDEVERMSLADKVLAAATIENNYALFDQEVFTPDELLHIDAVLYEHLLLNGPHGLKMSVRVGRAIKQSIKYPIVKKVTFVSKFKEIIKELLS